MKKGDLRVSFFVPDFLCDVEGTPPDTCGSEFIRENRTSDKGVSGVPANRRNAAQNKFAPTEDRRRFGVTSQ
jgi:hypothetical protein